MANKNHAGAQYMRTLAKENRLVDEIDKREAKGTNRENTDSTYNKYKLTPNGERVWSF